MTKKTGKKPKARIKVRVPLPQKPPKTIIPDTVYDRKKAKKEVKANEED